MRDPVLTKADMNRRLVAGEFGNTNPQWRDLAEWERDPAARRFTHWGLRHTTIAAFAGTRLNVVSSEVKWHVGTLFDWRDFNISPMIWCVGNVQWEGDVYDHPERGLICSGAVGPKPGTWRTHMLAPRLWEGSAARALLRSVLNPNSHDDLLELVARYPNHVYELSALDVCFGTVPDRNAVLWEVRRY